MSHHGKEAVCAHRKNEEWMVDTWKWSRYVEGTSRKCEDFPIVKNRGSEAAWMWIRLWWVGGKVRLVWVWKGFRSVAAGCKKESAGC